MKKKIISLLLIFAMLLGAASVTGCGKTGNEMAEENMPGKSDKQQEKKESAAEETQAEDFADDQKAMGRYVEQENDTLKEVLHARSRLEQMEDGSLAVFGMDSGKWVSQDKGGSWEKETLAWYEELKDSSDYIMDIATAPDGYVAVIYSQKADKEEKTENEEGVESTKEEEEGETGEEEEGLDLDTDIDFSFHPRYFIAAPDGTVMEFEIPYGDNDYVRTLKFSDDGRLFGTTLDGKVYEIDKNTGDYELVTELSDFVFNMEIKDNKMICENSEGVSIYDLATGTFVEDKVLDDFIASQFGARLEYYNETALELLIIPGEDNILYLICENGIYRHVIGGNLVEQLAEGALTSLGNPAYDITDGVLLEDGVFLVLFTNGMLMSYTYDPDMPAMPQVRLKAYSLTESGKLKLAIATYQSRHPEVYIQYETGIDVASSVTREDALKKLNTEIAAGNGPDIFVLDDMPVDSYIEKGILTDLSSLLEGKSQEEYFTSVLKSFQTEGGIYAVPTEFMLTLLVGKESDIGQMTDLNAIAGMMEKYRSEKEEGHIIGAGNEDELLAKLLPYCAPAWKVKQDKIDEAALEKFYTLAKRIWDIENAGITDEMREKEETYTNQMIESGMTKEQLNEWYLSLSGQMLDYLVDDQEFAMGAIADSFTFDTMISCFKIKGKTDSAFTICSGQVSGVLLPETVIGISQNSKYKENAFELLEGMIDGSDWGSFPVNKKEFRECLRTNATQDGGSYGGMAVADQDGTTISLDIYPASEEEIKRLERIAEMEVIPYISDSVLEEAVYEAGSKVLSGRISAQEGVQEVIKRTAIYMSE